MTATPTTRTRYFIGQTVDRYLFGAIQTDTLDSDGRVDDRDWVTFVTEESQDPLGALGELKQVFDFPPDALVGEWQDADDDPSTIGYWTVDA